MNKRLTVEELLEVAEEFCLVPEPGGPKSWWKLGDARGFRVYIKRATNKAGNATDVHFSGFCVDDPHVRELTAAEAEAMHLGNVRGIIGANTFKTASRSEILRVFRLGLEAVVESAGAALPRAQKTSARPASVLEGQPVAIEERLLRFIGYGTLDARLALLGIEEGFGGRLDSPGWTVQRELDARAGWKPIEDARDACMTLEDRYWMGRSYSPVWRNAAKLARAILEDAPDWADPEPAHQYVVSSLGRTSGETLLGELFPLPAVGLHHWPYAARWRDRDVYRRELWPQRRKLWREVLKSSAVRIVICYGSDVRAYACDLFGCAEGPGVFRRDEGSRRIVFAPFIGGRTSNELSSDARK